MMCPRVLGDWHYIRLQHRLIPTLNLTPFTNRAGLDVKFIIAGGSTHTLLHDLHKIECLCCRISSRCLLHGSVFLHGVMQSFRSIAM